MRVRLTTSVTLPLLLLACANSVSAEPITFRFSGIVTSNEIPSHTVPWLSSVSVGDPVSGTVRFDVSLPDSSSDPRVGAYLDPNGLIRVSFAQGTVNLGNSIFEDGITASVFDHAYPGGPEWGQDQVGFNGLASVSSRTISGGLGHHSGSGVDILQGVGIPLDPTVYSSFPLRFLALSDYSYEDQQLRARLHSFEPVSPAPVPEPASVMLLTTGLSALAWKVRRSRPRA